MIDYSIGEIESLILKACRGAGMSWGLSEEAARAAGILNMLGLPGLDSFARLLPRMVDIEHSSIRPEFVGDRCVSNGDYLCPVYAGAWLLDTPGHITAPEETIYFDRLAEPLIFGAFALQGALKHNRAISIKTADVSARCINGTIDNGNDLSSIETISDLYLQSTDTPPAKLNITHQRGTCSDDSLCTLEKFAHKTYVPASEASRRAGAGAGLTDND